MPSRGGKRRRGTTGRAAGEMSKTSLGRRAFCADSNDKPLLLWFPRSVNSSDSSALQPQMSPYEVRAWSELSEYWRRKADRRGLPPAAARAKDAVAGKIKDSASATSGFISDVTPQPVKDAGG